jgi:hypothetical protein
MNHLLSIIIFITSFFIPSMGWPQTPLWVEEFQKGSLISDNTYFGVGSADYNGQSPDHECQLLSKNRALDDLSYQLSVSITSELKDNLSQKGKYSEEQVTSSLFVSTRKVLSGIKEQEKWNDDKERRYWVMLAIDKNRAERQVQQQDFVNEVVLRLEKNQTDIKMGIEKIKSLIDVHTSKNDHRMKNMEKILARINQKIKDNPQKEYEVFIKKTQFIEKQWQRQESLSKNQAIKLDLLIQQNQQLTEQLTQLSSNIQKDHFLAMVEDDVKKQQDNQQLEVTITPEKGQNALYVKGETIRFIVTANQECYIKVIYLSTIDDSNRNETRINTLIFPNAHDKNNRIKAHHPTLIGRYDELEVQPPFGKDIITVVASTTQFNDLHHLIEESGGEYYSYKTDSIRGAIEARGIGDRKKAVTDTCFIVSKTY